MIRPGTHLWRRSEWCWVLLACAIPLGILFGPVLPRDRTFGLRDAAHYYAPLFRYVQSQWARGLPLWNPLEENGRPLLADPTASVLYPGKLVFALPCEFTSAYDLYIVAHIAGAAAAAYCAARGSAAARSPAVWRPSRMRLAAVSVFSTAMWSIWSAPPGCPGA